MKDQSPDAFKRVCWQFGCVAKGTALERIRRRQVLEAAQVELAKRGVARGPAGRPCAACSSTLGAEIRPDGLRCVWCGAEWR